MTALPSASWSASSRSMCCVEQCGPSRQASRRYAQPFLLSPTLEEAPWPCSRCNLEPFGCMDRASLMALATAFERDSRTVKQVTIPVHGANPQRRPQAPPPARRSQAPCGRRPAGPPVLGVACSNAGHARPAYSRASAGPRHTVPCRHAAEVLSLRRLRRLIRSDSTGWVNNDADCRGVSAMTARDGFNRLPNAGTIPYGKTDWPWTVGHAPGDTSPTALTTG